MTTDEAKTADKLVGTTLEGRYRVIRRIASGSVGIVYEVQHELIQRRLALKMLHPELGQDAEAVKRFHREAKAAAMIGHANIVHVTDMGILPDAMPFIVLELLEGQDLGRTLRELDHLPVPRAVDIAIQCCRALDAAHQAGIIHRDLKPDNIFLVSSTARQDFVKVLDFGMSKIIEAAHGLGNRLTRTGAAVGTPYYMSPEQMNGAPDIDARSDVYSIGVVLYQMLTGRVPFQAANLAQLVVKVLQEPAPALTSLRPEIPSALEAIVLRALAKEPADRFHTAGELADTLMRFIQEESPEDFSTTYVCPVEFDEKGQPFMGEQKEEPVMRRTKRDANHDEELPATISQAIRAHTGDNTTLPSLGSSSLSTSSAEVAVVRRIDFGEKGNDEEAPKSVEHASPTSTRPPRVSSGETAIPKAAAGAPKPDGPRDPAGATDAPKAPLIDLSSSQSPDLPESSLAGASDTKPERSPPAELDRRSFPWVWVLLAVAAACVAIWAFVWGPLSGGPR